MPSPPNAKQLKAIGLRLKAARKERGLSRADVGKKLGVSVCMMSHMETGKRRLSVQRAADLKEALGIDPALVWPDVVQAVNAE